MPKRKPPFGIKQTLSPQRRALKNGQITLTLPQALQQALAAYQRRDWVEAERICRLVLNTQADYFDALNLLGIIAAQTQRAQEAVALLERAAGANPNNASAHNNLGNTLKELNRLDDALRSYDRAIKIQPDYAEALSNRGNTLKALNRLHEALDSYDQALKVRPDYAEAHSNRGTVLHALNRLDGALDSYDQALKVRPDYAEAHSNRGTVLHALNRLDAALESYDQALKIRPDYAEAHNNRGITLQALNKLHEALDSYDRALKLRPNYPEAFNNRGVTLLALNRPNEALDSYDRALKLRPNYADAYNNRGIALHDLQRMDEALENCERAIQINPDYADAYSNRGIVLHELNRMEEALDSYARALQIKPNYAEACLNRGNTLQELMRLDEALASYEQALKIRPRYVEAYGNRGSTLQKLKRLDEALDSYKRALEIQPDYPDAHWNLSLCRLLMGDFSLGWTDYEWRWRVKAPTSPLRGFKEPLWLGKASLQGKTILLHSEQGLGDTLQFCRYAKWVRDLGAHVVMEVQKPLLGLLQKLDGVARLIGRGDALPPFDYHCPLLSLPLAFGTDLNTIPAVAGPIAGDPAKVAGWRARLGERTKPRIGLVWSGSTIHKNDRNRSVALHDVVRHLPQDWQYVSLQKEVRESDQAALNSQANLLHVGEHLNDFTDTAALCSLMDVVVSVDTSVAHLAGTLGKPVWILLPFIPDWRWLLEREDSPWYPSARLFRQPAIGDWDSVLAHVGKALRQYGD
jgi:tetratricopeptide (TPR) repeat protein